MDLDANTKKETNLVATHCHLPIQMEKLLILLLPRLFSTFMTPENTFPKVRNHLH